MKLSSDHTHAGDRASASAPRQRERASSVHPFATVDGSTVTGDLMLVVLQVELVVVRQLRHRETHTLIKN